MSQVLKWMRQEEKSITSNMVLVLNSKNLSQLFNNFMRHILALTINFDHTLFSVRYSTKDVQQWKIKESSEYLSAVGDSFLSH